MFYTATEMMALIGCTRMTLYLWRHATPPKGPPCIKLESGALRYRKSTVHAWLKAMERGETYRRPRDHPIAKSRPREADPVKELARRRAQGITEARQLVRHNRAELSKSETALGRAITSAQIAKGRKVCSR